MKLPETAGCVTLGLRACKADELLEERMQAADEASSGSGPEQVTGLLNGAWPSDAEGADEGPAKPCESKAAAAAAGFGQASLLSCVFNLTNTVVGAGMLGLPAAFASSGLVLGAVFLLGFGCFSALGLRLLAQCARTVGRPASFYAVADAAAPAWAFAIDLAIAIKCFGVATSYFIVIGDLLPQIADAMGAADDSAWARRPVWITAALGLVAPLAAQRRLDALRFTSGLSLGFVAFLCVLVIAYALGAGDACDVDDDGGDDRSVRDYSGLRSKCGGKMAVAKGDADMLRVLTIFIFAYTCQQNTFSITNELARPTPARVDRVIVVSIGSARIQLCIDRCIIHSPLFFTSSIPAPNSSVEVAQSRVFRDSRFHRDPKPPSTTSADRKPPHALRA